MSILPRAKFRGRTARLLVVGLLPFVPTACSDPAGNVTGEDDRQGPAGRFSCSLQADRLTDGGVPRDGIPALTDPLFVAPDDPDASYLRPDDRVISFRIAGTTYAVPHNVLWWHEIVNLDAGGEQLAVTYCPLTGSSLVFDRASVGGAEFGVSGLLFQNNLMMFDRRDEESLWPQMSRTARCGPRSGTELTMYPSMEMRWERWRSIYADGRVVSSRTGFRQFFDYGQYPYGPDYEDPHSDRLLFPSTVEIDPRRPPKERVLGIPGRGGTGIAFPFGSLQELGEVGIATADVRGEEVVVFWEAAARTAVAHHPRAGGDGLLTFEVRGGEIVDVETGSRWRVDGISVAGPLEGERLEPVQQAYVSFWFSWAAFHLATFVWTPPA